MSKVNIIMDMSQYDTFLLCEERYNNRYNKNKTLPTKAHQLDRGTVVHAAQEVYYNQLKEGIAYNDRVTAALSEVRRAGVVSDLEVEDVSRILEVMEEYYDYWKVADQNLRIIEVEKAFIYLLHEDDEVRIYLSGKIDLIYSDEKYTNMPMDHKSYDRDFPILEMNNQFRNYCNAISSNYLVVNRIGFQKTLPPEKKYKRLPLTYDHLQIEQWKNNVIKVILNRYLHCAATGDWTMNETSCDKYHRKCEYYDVCNSSGKEAKMYKLSANYITIDPWDVTKSLRKPSEIIKDSEEELKNDRPNETEDR
jgi:hypothetical protein